MIDLIRASYDVVNPIEIAELIELEFDQEVNILEIENYLEPEEDFERLNREFKAYH